MLKTLKEAVTMPFVMESGQMRPSSQQGTARLIATQKELCDEARSIMEAKNHDYGGHNDPFANFREYGELGIMVRLGDKMSRIKTFLEKGELKVKDEGFRDTVKDAINYLGILYAYVTWGRFIKVLEIGVKTKEQVAMLHGSGSGGGSDITKHVNGHWHDNSEGSILEDLHFGEMSLGWSKPLKAPSRKPYSVDLMEDGRYVVLYMDGRMQVKSRVQLDREETYMLGQQEKVRIS